MKMSVNCLHTLFVIFCVAILTVRCEYETPDDWVDPGDMLTFDPILKKNIKAKEDANENGHRPKKPNIESEGVKRKEDLKQSNDIQPNCSACPDKVCPPCPVCPNVSLSARDDHSAKKVQTKIDVSLIRRFVAVFINKLSGVGQPPHYTGYELTVELHEADWTFLEQFLDKSKSKSVHEVLKKIEDSITDVFPSKDDRQSRWRWKFEDLFRIKVDEVIKVTVLILILVAILCMEAVSRISWSRQLVRMLVLIFVLSYIWTYYHQYQMAVATHKAKSSNIPERCKNVKQDLSTAQEISRTLRDMFSISKDPCAEYHEGFLINPIFEIPPTKILAITLSQFFLEPLEHMGTTFSRTFKNMLSELPIHLWIPAFIFVIILMLALLALLTVCFGYTWNIRLPFWTGIEIGPNRTALDIQRADDRMDDYRNQIENLQNVINDLRETARTQAIEPPAARQPTTLVALLHNAFSQAIGGGSGNEEAASSPPQDDVPDSPNADERGFNTEFPMPPSSSGDGDNLRRRHTYSVHTLPYPPEAGEGITAASRPFVSDPDVDASYSGSYPPQFLNQRPTHALSDQAFEPSIVSTNLGDPPAYPSQRSPQSLTPHGEVGFARHVLEDLSPGRPDAEPDRISSPATEAETIAQVQCAPSVIPDQIVTGPTVDNDDASSTSSIEILSHDDEC